MARSNCRFWRCKSFMSARPCRHEPRHKTERCWMPKPRRNHAAANLNQAGELRRAGHAQAARNVLAAAVIVRQQSTRRLP